MKPKFTPEEIKSLKSNEVFVFGSNLNGNHAGGAARLAVEKFGAIMGQAEGIQGQSYAIPTLDKDMNKVSMDGLAVYLGNFRKYANENQDKTFYLTKIGCGIAGFDINTIAYQIVRARLPKNVILPVEFTEIKGFKGFNPDMTCRDFQYKVGGSYEEKGEIQACSKGFHFCTNPFDVFGYYPPSDEKGMNKFCEVKGTGDMSVDTDDSKVACSKIHISAEIGLKGVIDAGVKFIFNKVDWKDNKKSNTGDQSAATNTGYRSAATNTGDQSAATNTGYQSAATNTGDQSAATNTGYQSAATNTGDRSAATNTGYRSAATNTGYQSAATNTGYQSAATNTGDRSAATNTGYQSAATNTGDQSAATNTGDQSAATNTGYQSAATNTGDQSAATNTGYQSAATNTGDRSAATNTGYRSAATNTGYQSAATNTGYQSAATNTGDQSAATNTGYQSAATNTGDQSAASVEGKDSIAIVTGRDSKAKGTIGCWIVLTEREDWDGETYPIKEVRAFKVDGENIKANTWYKLIDGEPIECEWKH